MPRLCRTTFLSAAAGQFSPSLPRCDTDDVVGPLFAAIIRRKGCAAASVSPSLPKAPSRHYDGEVTVSAFQVSAERRARWCAGAHFVVAGLLLAAVASRMIAVPES